MKKKLLQSFCWVLLLISSLTLHAQVQFSITQTNNVYQVKMKPTVSYSGTSANTLSAQVTIVAPTGNFTPIASSLQSQFGNWTYVTQITRGPIENPNFDYISFYMSSPVSTANYVAGTEQNLFSFQATGTCSGNIQLINNPTDPFFPSQTTGTNSQNVNVGNQIAISGNGNLNNAWNSNYGSGVGCPNGPPCGIKYELVKISANSYQVNMIPQVTYTAPNNQTSTQQVTLKVPSGLAYTNLISLTSGANYIQGSRINAPSQAPNNDYILFNLANLGTSALPYTSGVSVPLFKFDVPGTCSGSLLLMPNNDPFTANTSFNSKQQLTVNGYGSPDIPVCFAGTGVVPCPAPASTCQVEYEIESLGNGKYQVSMIPKVTYSAPNNITATQQVTIKVPTGFQYNNLTNLVSGATYIQGSRVNSPSQAPAFDYLMFNLANLGTSALTYTNGQKVPLFTFDKTGLCLGTTLGLMQNNDPFTANTSFNSKQQLTVNGYGIPDIPICIKGTGEVSCVETTCQVEYEIEALTNGKYQISMIPKVTYSAPNNITGTQQVTIKVPTGFQYNNLTNLVSGATYIQGSRVNSPSQAPAFDYLMFNLANLGTSALTYTNGQKVPLFTFDKTGLCLGATLSLMQNNDPFAANTSFNSKQQLTVNGYGIPDIPICIKGTGSVACQDNPTCLIKYQLETVNGCEYQVSMIPDATWTSPNNITKNGKVTLRVPHNCFTVADLTSLTFGANFTVAQIVQAPPSNPNYDYICFNMTTVPTVAIDYVKDVKVPLFTFKNSGNCCENIELMPSTDPMAQGNTSNANISQHWTNSGTGTSGVEPCIVGTAQPCISNNSANILGADRTICEGQSTQLNVTGTFASYLWSPGATLSSTTVANPTATPLTTTTYYVTATTVAGCPLKDEIVVTVTPAPSISSVTSSNSTNCASANGSITINATSTGTIEYSINGGATWAATNVFNNLTAGAYNVMVRTQGSTCSKPYAQNPINITGNVSFNVTAVNTINPTCGSNNGQIAVTVTGAGGPFLYSLNGGTYQMSPFFAGLAVGTYTITVKDAVASCTVNAPSVNLTAAVSPNILAVTPTATTDCSAVDGSINIAASGTGALEYSINGIAWQSTNIFTNVAAGSYIARVRNADNTCMVTANTPVIVAMPTMPTITNVLATAPTTCGTSNGTITVTGSGGQGQLEFSIDGTTWQTGGVFTNLSSGTYNVFIRNQDNSCAKPYPGNPVVINAGQAPVLINVSKTYPTTCGSNNGSIVVTAQGTSTLEYSINNGTTYQASNTFNGLSGGIYNIVVRYANSVNCTSSLPNCIIPSANPATIASVVPTSTSDCGQSDGTITINANGGNAPLQYSINNGLSYQSSNIFTGLAAGSYSIKVKNADGTCDVSHTSLVAVTSPSAPSISASTTTSTTCGASTGTITANVTGGTAPLQYSINGISWQTSNVFNNLAAGSYYVYVRNANGSCVSVSNAVTIVSQPGGPNTSVVAVSNSTVCGATGNGSISITSTGGTAPLQYSINGGITFQASNIFSGLSAGTYNIVVRNANGTCPAIVSPITIIAPVAPSIISSITTNPQDCATGGTITVNANGINLEYSLNGTTWQTSNVFTSVAAGNYTISVRNVGSTTCIATSPSQVTLTSPTPPSILTVISGAPASCGQSNGSITINSNPTTGVQYSIDNIHWQNSGVFAGLSAGSYNVRIRYATGNCNVLYANNPVVLTAANGPQVVSTQVANPTDCIANNGSITIYMTGGTAPFQFSKDNGLTYQLANIFSNLAAGTYNILIKDASGACSTSTTATLIAPVAPASPILTTTSATSCSTPTGSVVVSFPLGVNLEYSINNGATWQLSPSFNNVVAGTYVVQARVIGTTCSSASLATTINMPTMPIIAGVDATFGIANCAVTNGAITINVSNAGSWEYSIDGGLSWSLTNIFTNLQQGSYMAMVRPTGKADCAKPYQGNPIVMKAPDAPAVLFMLIEQPATCSSGTGKVTITAQGATEYSINAGTTWQASNVFSSLAAGTYQVRVRNATGCISNGSPVQIQGANAPTGMTATSSQISTCGGSNGMIAVTSITGGTAPYEYSINGATWQNSNIFLNLAAGNYTVQVRNVGSSCAFVSAAPISITAPIAAIFNSVNSTPATCGNTNGTITVSASSGAQYSIDGVNYQNNGSFANLSAGSYLVYVKNANGTCTTPYPLNPVVISQTPGVNITSVIVTQLNSCNATNGGITVNATGGNAPYEYSINGGITFQVSNIFSALTAGTYNIVVRGTGVSAQCPTTYTPITLVAPSAPKVAASISVNPTACNNDGKITVLAVNGVAPLEYSIDGLAWQSSNVFSGLAVGNYTIRVRNANGSCSITAPNTVTLTSPNAVVVSNVVKTDPSTCTATNGSITISASPNTNVQYSIDGLVWQTSNTFNGLAAGSYKAYVRNANGTCISAYGANPILLNGAGAPVIVNVDKMNPTDCNALNGSLTIEVSNTGTQYKYSIDNGITYQLSNYFAGLAAGTYNVKVSDLAGNCPAVLPNVVLTSPQGAIIAAVNTTPTVNCGTNTGSISITATPNTGIQYSIDNGANWTTSNVFNGLAAASYVVKVRNINGTCVQTYATAAVVTEPNRPTISTVTSSNPTTCGISNGSITITATGGTGTFEYSINGTTWQTIGNFTGLATGSYIVFVRNSGSNCAEQYAQLVVLSAPSAASIFSVVATNPTTCSGNNGVITINAGGAGTLEYSINGGVSYQASNIFNNILAGNYNIRVRSVGGACTVSYPQVTLVAPSAPVIVSATATPTSACNFNDGKITIIANNSQNVAMEYSVDGTNWFTANVIQYLQAGAYTVRVRIQGTNCITTASATTTIPAPSTNLVVNNISKINPTVCGANNGSISVSSTGGAAPVEYSIDNINWQTSTQFINLPAGTYMVYARDNGGVCKVAYGSNPVILTPNIASPIIPSVSKTNVTTCGANNGTLTISTTGGTAPLQYSINGGQTWVSNNVFNGLAAGYYDIAVRNNDGTCATIHVPVQITAPLAPVLVAAILTKPTDCANPNAKITILAAGGIPPLQYSIDNQATWSTSNVFSNLGVGYYNVWVRNSDGSCATPAANNPIVSCEFDLALRKNRSVGQDSIVRLGQDVSFDIKVYNQGVVTAKDIEVVDYLPIGTLLSPSDNNGWSYLDAAGNITAVTPKIDPTIALRVKKTIAGPLVSKDSATVKIKLRIMFGGPNVRLVNVAEIAGAKDISGVTRQDGDSTPDAVKGNDKEQDDVIDDKNINDEDDEDPAPIKLDDYDPHGYIYCDKSGTLMKGGHIQLVSAPVGGAIYFANDINNVPIDGRDGVYQFFTNGVPGNYSVTYVNPNGFQLSTMILPNIGSFNPAGTDGTGIDKDNLVNNIVKLGANAANGELTTIAAGQNPYYLSFTFNAGETTIISHNNIPVGCACVNSIVCEDVNNNGIAEPTEPGVNGVTVEAYNCTTNTLVGSTLTTNGGKYKISGLLAGSYRLKFILPSGYSYVQNGTPVAVNTQGETACFPLALNGCEDKPVCIKLCPTVTVSPNVTICAGSSTTLTATGAASYTWTGTALSSNNGASVIANPNVTTVYTVNAISGNCSTAATVTVTVVTPPSSNFTVTSTQPTSCATNNGTISISATPNTGLEYSIDNGNTWSASSTFSNLASAAYIVKIRNAGSQCSTTYGSNPIQLHPASAPNITNVVTVNPNNCTNPNGSITISANGGSGSLEYSVNNGATWQVTNQFNGLAAGTYNIKVRNSNGSCEGTYPTVTLTNNAPVINAVNVVADCANNNRSITILASGGQGPLEYSINNGATWTTNNVFTGLAAGFYNVKIRNFNGTCEVAYANGQIAMCAFDLALEKKLAPNQSNVVRLGDVINYQVIVTNQGTMNATNVQVVDYIPTGMQLYPTGNNGWTAVGTDMATNTISSLAAGASVTLNLSMRLVFGSPNASLKNVAEIKSAKDAAGNLIADIDSTPDMIKGNDTEKDGVTNEDGKNGGDEDDSDSENITLDNFDPSGYIYCEKTGKIITGGKMKLVTAPQGGDIFFTTDAKGDLLDGSTGMYQIFTNGVPGVYTFTYEHPNKYPLSSKCPPQSGAFNPAGKDGDATYDKDGLKNGMIHLGSLVSNGYLADKSCAANKYFLSFNLEKDEKTLIVTNNIPVACGVINGKICADANNDGIPQSNEPGIAGMKVLLFDCKSTNGVAIASTITDASGNYSFDGLTAGSYKVQIIATNGQIIKGGTFSQTGYSACTDVKFGDCIALNACISSCPTINNVLTVMPWCPKNNGVIIIDAVCQGDLEYSIDGGKTYQHLNAFMNLAPGSYTIKVKSAGCEQDYKNVIVLACENDNGNNGKGSISGKAFKDCSGAGLKGANKGIANVKVTLTGTTTKTTTTDANGLYNFTDLAAGDYVVSFEKLGGFEFSKQNQGNDDNNDSDVSLTGVSASISLAVKQLKDNVDAGMQDVQAPSITFTHPWLVGKKDGDTVYMDCGKEQVLLPTDAKATDNCDKTVVMKMEEEPAIISKDCSKDGYLVKMHCGWAATDECGNKSIIWLNIIVRDVTPPTLVGVPASVTITDKDAIPAAPVVKATDTCDKDITVQFNETKTGNVIGRTWIAVDDCGNKALGTQTITITTSTGGPCTTTIVPVPVIYPATCAGKDGIAKLTPTTLTYKWADGYVGDIRKDLAVGTYSVTGTDSKGCTVVFNVIVKDGCVPNPISISKTRDVRQVPCGSGENEYCFDLDFIKFVTEYQLLENGEIFKGKMQPCSNEQHGEYSLDGVLTNTKLQVEKWEVGGKTFTFNFTGLDELAKKMNEIDPKGDWTADAANEAIKSNSYTKGRYGLLRIKAAANTQVWILSPSEFAIPLGLKIKVQGMGVHELVFTHKVKAYTDTLMVNFVCTTTETISLDLEEGQMEEVKLSGAEMVGVKCELTKIQDETTNQAADFRIATKLGPGFIEVEGMKIGQKQVTYLMCDEFKVCDTTIVRATVRELKIIKEAVDSTITVYDAFSPNGDGINEVFKVKNIEFFPENTVIIYNRWGNAVYTKDAYDNSWRGTFGEKDLPNGTYFYHLEIKGQKARSGFLYLQR